MLDANWQWISPNPGNSFLYGLNMSIDMQTSKEKRTPTFLVLPYNNPVTYMLIPAILLPST